MNHCFSSFSYNFALDCNIFWSEWQSISGVLSILVYQAVKKRNHFFFEKSYSWHFSYVCIENLLVTHCFSIFSYYFALYCNKVCSELQCMVRVLSILVCQAVKQMKLFFLEKSILSEIYLNLILNLIKIQAPRRCPGFGVHR